MCIIAYLPAGKTVTEKEIENMYGSNKDWFGISIRVEDKLIVQKWMIDLAGIKNILLWEMAVNNEVVAHFRLATDGTVNKLNCHPFILDEDIRKIQKSWGIKDSPVLHHNGIFSEFKTTFNSSHSDTVEFISKFFHKVSDMDQKVIEKFLGWNKLVLHSPEWVKIYNEKSGVWDGERWFSNNGFKTYSTYRAKPWSTWSYKGWWEDYDDGYYASSYKDTIRKAAKKAAPIETKIL